MKNSNMIGRGMFISFLMFSFSMSTLAQSKAENASDFDGEDFEIYGTVVTDFQWVRGQYTNYPGGGRGFSRRRGGGWWDTDFPDSDENFLRGVQRYTNIDTNPKNYKHIELTDQSLFENIFLYMNWKRVPIGTSFSGPNFSE